MESSLLMLESGLEKELLNGEESADSLEKILKITPENQKEAGNIFISFFKSYYNKDKNISNQEWLSQEFSKYPDLWSDVKAREKDASLIIRNIDISEKASTELTAYNNRGLSDANWLNDKIEQGMTLNGIVNFKDYAGKIENILETANKQNIDLIYCKNGEINQSRNLDGFLAEQHHADTYNIEAASHDKDSRAVAIQPKEGETYKKNSLDMGVYDKDKILRKRYQSKYGADPKSTEALFKKGDYRGQRKLVPKGHTGQVEGSTDRISHDGIESNPLSKTEAKERQRRAQEDGEAQNYDWNDTNHLAIVKNIGKQASIASLASVGFVGAKVLGSRMFNFLTGKNNKGLDEETSCFVEKSLKTGVLTGIKVAATGAVVVITKKGLLGDFIKNTPVGHITNAVSIGIENLKVFYKLGKDEISTMEAVHLTGKTSTSMMGGIISTVQGARLGASLGTIIGGPILAGIGAFVGGGIAGMLGGSVAGLLYEGGRKIIGAATKVVRSIGERISGGVRSIGSKIKAFFS